MTQYDPQNPPHIRPGQVWTSAAPRDSITVRVVSVQAGRVSVVDAYDSKRPRSIWAREFHASPLTRTGDKRKSGYILVSPAPDERECQTPWHTHDNPTTITGACQIPPVYVCNGCGEEVDDETAECCEDGEIVPAEYDEVAQ
ncbi:hypothetical protein KGD82_16650 [Nocardiopsis eucommiae]|uniref:Uncharacterized protein n=1 Tax=Nocardiopsis eucommiae TaxID=2831970 RepID=A0A975L6N7_9ACTN|nr:hypothetical protein KGD82_16650 [Nocardiopsis eucommiae]